MRFFPEFDPRTLSVSLAGPFVSRSLRETMNDEALASANAITVTLIAFIG